MGRAVSFKTGCILLFITLIGLSCKDNAKTAESHRFTNALIDETSPYLLQHAHNPVDWIPWSTMALKKAQQEDKLIVVSIGYSSCHWCHVMEEETFEDTEVAALMNENYISIKVDREERPDVDQVYMTAAQLMTGKGGWPLNVILLPNGKPLYGGTYHTKAQWIKVLTELNKRYKEDRQGALDYANRVAAGIAEVNIIDPVNKELTLSQEDLITAITQWKISWDMLWGGSKEIQKFIVPVSINFLMEYSELTDDVTADVFVKTTLDKVLQGGIYDQIGGGFFRYSTDPNWKVPHFEKMLYDNAQLISLYSRAYRKYKDPAYKDAVIETIAFLDREMKDPQGGYYAAIDADSEGEEGTYYVWQETELKNVLGQEYSLFAKYYNIRKEAVWEKDQYVLHRTMTDADFAKSNDLSAAGLAERKMRWKSLLLEQRSQRVAPGIDDKIITSWNALLIDGFVEAYQAFGNPDYLARAEETFQFITNKAQKQGRLVHTYKEGSKQKEGFLEDYSFLSHSSLTLYATTLKEYYLDLARQWTTFAQEQFQDMPSGMYRYSGNESLISKIIKTDDGVLPSPNAVMAQNFFTLGHLLYDTDYLALSEGMVTTMTPRIKEAPSNYTAWANMLLHYNYPFYEIVAVGPEADELLQAMHDVFLPNTLFAGSITTSDLPLFKDRYVPGKTYIYVCDNNTCKLPVETTMEALQQLRSFRVY
jgi:uncharacterized protein YyaL (SSP411 family)